ncbi:MAG: tetratricopeptide repeat protein [Alphaproteobacteria bacterium]
MPEVPTDSARTYVAARAAAISGDHAGAAELYARLAQGSTDSDLRQKAITEAISAGDMPLALRLIGQNQDVKAIDARLLLVAEALKNRQDGRAIQLLAKSGNAADLSFWEPLVRSWNHAERGDVPGALAILARVPRNSAFSPFVDEQSAMILLKARKTAEAEPFARRAIGNAGAREYRVRLALAAGFAEAGDKTRANAMLEGISGDTGTIRRALESGRLAGLRIDSVSEAFAEQLVALALEMRRSPVATAPVNIVQIARYAAPDNSSAAVLLGNFLAGADRVDDALKVYRSVPSGDPLKTEALDAEARTLVDAKRFNEALALSLKAAQASSATSDDFARLADVYSEMKRHSEAAAAYQRAAELASQAAGGRVWPLLLLQASALESAGRWPEAKAVLSRAMAIAPDEPLILNFLGYAKLEHGEDLDAAEALIRKASQLAPDDASITDSLGWALYKRGRLDEAIEVLQRAAAGDPAQAEIHEHLGDALYTAGRHFEARFAWQAALATAEEEDTQRLRQKLEVGLTEATAAP